MHQHLIVSDTSFRIGEDIDGTAYCNLTMTFEFHACSESSLVFATLTIPARVVGSCNNSWAIFLARDVGSITSETYRLPISDAFKCSSNTSTEVNLLRFPMDASRFSDFLNTEAEEPLHIEGAPELCIAELTIDVLLIQGDVGAYGQLELQEPITMTLGLQELPHGPDQAAPTSALPEITVASFSIAFETESLLLMMFIAVVITEVM